MTDSQPTNPLGRILRLPGRTKLFVAIGLALVAIAIFAPQSCAGDDIGEEQAIATARTALEAAPGAFEPERIETKLLRQGFPAQLMWVVVFTVPDAEGGREDFLRHAAVWVDAGSGEVRRVSIREPG